MCCLHSVFKDCGVRERAEVVAKAADACVRHLRSQGTGGLRMGWMRRTICGSRARPAQSSACASHSKCRCRPMFLGVAVDSIPVTGSASERSTPSESGAVGVCGCSRGNGGSHTQRRGPALHQRCLPDDRHSRSEPPSRRPHLRCQMCNVSFSAVSNTPTIRRTAIPRSRGNPSNK